MGIERFYESDELREVEQELNRALNDVRRLEKALEAEMKKTSTLMKQLAEARRVTNSTHDDSKEN